MVARWSSVDLAPESIVYVDDDLLAVDKPAGVLSDATRDPARQHLGTAASKWAEARGEVADFHPAHRLDRATSGIVLFARGRESATALMRQFQDRRVAKRYEAVVVAPSDADWTAGSAFARRSHLRHRKGRTDEVHSGGKPAESSFEVVSLSGGLALLRAWPQTGRTHQLRVHLAALDAPILGDDLYTPKSAPTSRPDAARLWLHAAELSITHPRTEQPLVVRSRRQLALVDGAAGEIARD